ncbi:MAG: hypothetical protein ACK4N5_05930 [Myxococcales bacterium]
MDERKTKSKGERRTVEAWATEKATPAWLFAGAKAGERWAIGAELTEDEYTAAIQKAASITIR